MLIEGLTEEQQKAVDSEIDRRVSEAVKTNTTKVTESVTAKLSGEFDSRMAAAMEEAKKQGAMSEADKITALETALAEQKAAFERSQLERKTEHALHEAGLTPDAVTKLTPMIVGASNTETLDATIDAFVSVQKSAIESALQKQKQELAAGYSEPSSSGTPGKIDPQAQFNAIMNQEGMDTQYASAQAVQFLLDQAAM